MDCSSPELLRRLDQFQLLAARRARNTPAKAQDCQQFSFWNFSAFGVHALACLAAADTLKGGHQTPQIRQNENRCRIASRP